MATAKITFTKQEAQIHLTNMVVNSMSHDQVDVIKHVEVEIKDDQPLAVEQPAHPFSLEYPCPITVLRYIAADKMVVAIKELRTITNWGLNDAKRYHDAIRYMIKFDN